MDLRATFARHWPDALRWASARAPAGDAEDVAQDAFEALARHEDEVEPRSARAWLRTAVGHIAMRAAAKRREVPGDEDAGHDVTPELQLGQAQTSAALLELVERLEPFRREAFRRHVIDDQPVAAVAEAQGVPLETAKKRIRLARENLREVIARERAKGRRSRLGVFFFVDWLRDRWQPALFAAGVGLGFAAGTLEVPPLATNRTERAVHIVELSPLSFATPAPAAEREAAAPAVAPSSAEHDGPALALLLSAQTAIESGRAAEAAVLLREYDRTRPGGGPYAELRARLGAQIAR